MPPSDTSSSTRMRLAVVSEDEILLRYLICEVLKSEGLHVEAFATADEALEYLDRHAHGVSVVVSNVRMPGSITGLELARLVAERWPALPVILMSGYAGLEIELPPGVPFLRKPWTLDQLSDAVRHVLPLC